MTDFGNAGVVEERFGKDNRFHRRIQHPWICKVDFNSHELLLLESLFNKFALLEATSFPDSHFATIVDKEDGSRFDIKISANQIFVYPTENNHYNSSERLLKIFKFYGGTLEPPEKKVNENASRN